MEEPTPLPGDRAEREKRASEDAALYCTPEALEADAKYLQGGNVLEVSPITVEVPGGTQGRTARLTGASLRLRAAPSITTEWLDQVIVCRRARGVLGKLGAEAAAKDPFWSPESWIDVDVRSALPGFAVELRTGDPEDAEKLLARARAFAETHAVARVVAAIPAPKPEAKPVPFAWADWGWLNGNSRQTDFPLDGPIFTGSFNVDVGYNYDFANPKDHTIVGSTEAFYSNELQITHLGIGGDLHWGNVRGRFMTQLGMYSTTTPRNDGSVVGGSWDLSDAYRYIAEAYGGYHFDVLYGLNIDAGIFLSYVGLCSYYDYENWTDQASYVSSNTPWFFEGIRIQLFTSDRLKIEPWIINGWQSYGMYNEMPGLGFQIQWRPYDWLATVFSAYTGQDTELNPGRMRFHTDNSVLIRYFQNKESWLSKGAVSITLDAGCENGGGVSCFNGSASAPTQYFFGWMVYDRLWFLHDKLGFTAGGGQMSNPGRYLVLTPPINGATAASGTSYFPQGPGLPFWAWDTTWTLDYMPLQYVTLRAEYTHRWASVPYFEGPGGITPPGGDQGGPGSVVPGWSPSLQQDEDRFTLALMVRI